MATASAGREPITDEKIMALLAAAEWPLGSTEVAERYDISQQAAYYRLQQLVDEGRVEKRTTGGTTLWRPA